MTQKYGIIGFPLDHTFSPYIHNTAFNFLKINARYDKFEIPPISFEKDISRLKSENINGFNVTVPYKQKILPFLDEIEPIAKKVGAVNTIKKLSKNYWKGYNTDLYGFIQPLRGYLSEIKNVLIIGAGGAAKAACFSLLSEKKEIELTIVNRTIENADKLRTSLIDSFKNIITTHSLLQMEIIQMQYDLIVNTTNVGMGKLSLQIPLGVSGLVHKNSVVYDLIYNPEETLFLQSVSNKNIIRINGLQMLIGQAKKSFSIWTDKEYPYQILDENNFYKSEF